MIDIFPISYKEKNIADLIHDIRKKVFVMEQHVDPWLESDEFEQTSQHYIAYYKNKAVGTARWRITHEGVKLERFAVLKPFRNFGVGNALLKKVMEDVTLLNKPVYVHAQTHAAPFYEKAGFIKSSDIFMEANIPHCKMYHPVMAGSVQ